jgi:Methionine biosynthesis protein MetW
MTAYGMERLTFRLHNFTRVSWVSDRARAVWEPRVQRVAACWQEIEWRAVSVGIRPCALVIVAPQQTAPFGEQLAAFDLCAAPLDQLAVSSGAYTTFCSNPLPGQTRHGRLVIGSPQNIAALQLAWEQNQQQEIGRLLGYPPCCTAFFSDVWVREQFIDTTWPMAAGRSHGHGAGSPLREVSGPPENNILLRWLGVRAVPHLPCAFDCAASLELARNLIALGRESGYDVEMEWLLAMLDWPAAWSALHGIAEIKLPVCKISAVTDATPRKYSVHRAGGSFPQEGATGLVFPFAQPANQRVSASRAFERGLRNPIRLQDHRPRPARYYQDNGFASRQGMDRAHQPVVTLALALLPPQGGRVLDLGCGNGALLRKLQHRNQDIAPYGLEIDAAKIAYAHELLPGCEDRFFSGDMFTNEAVWQAVDRYDLVILMLGRLLEVSGEQAEKLKARLRSHAARLLVYVYADYPLAGGDLALMATEAGVELIAPDLDAGVSLATP